MERRNYHAVVIIISLCALLVVPFRAVGAEGNEWTGNVNAFLGGKSLDENDWGAVNGQVEIGTTLDFRKAAWPVNAAIDFLYSKGDGIFISSEGSTWELDPGIRKIFDNLGYVKPFVGGGPAIIHGEYTNGVSLGGNDTGLGFWIDGGLYFTLGRNFNIGGEIRYSKANVTISGDDKDAGGIHYGLILGYHW